MSDKSCQLAKYLVPSSSITSLRNLAFIPNRHLEKLVTGLCNLKGED